MPVTIPLEVSKHIFDYFSVREHGHLEPVPSSGLCRVSITPFLPSEACTTLHPVSLTCKSFNELARAITLKDSFIESFADFIQLYHMARHCRVFPIEILQIIPSDISKEPIRDITSPEFLFVMKQCIRFQGLFLAPLLLTSSRLPWTLESLTQYGSFANLRSLELFMPDPDDPLPDPNDVSQVLLLMPKLTVLSIHVPVSRSSLPHQTSKLLPPPFRLEYLVMHQNYLDLEWLTSTSHNHLRVAHYDMFSGNDLFLNLDHPWPELLYLNLLFDLYPETVLKTLHRCPNLAFLTLEFAWPMSENEERHLVNLFDALQHPLKGLTLAFVDCLSDPVVEETHSTILAAAVENHPLLSELRAFTIEFGRVRSHDGPLNSILPLQRVCEARGIQFATVCDCSRSSPCDYCGTPGYVIPMPDVL